MNKKASAISGFTLIELLLVMAIVGIMATLAVVNFVGVRQRGRDAQRKSDLAQVRAALELYRSDLGTYPVSAGSSGLLFCTGNGLVSGTTTYMKKLPCDPSGGGGTFKYTYYSVSAVAPVSSYTIVACLENLTDPQKDTPSDTSNCTGSSASYTVSSP